MSSEAVATAGYKFASAPASSSSRTTPCRFVFTNLRRGGEQAACQIAEVELTGQRKQPIRVVGAAGSSAMNHPASLATDGKRYTKWLTMNGPPWILRLALPVAPGTSLNGWSYTFITADDEPARDPIAWRFECRRPDGAFALVDEQRGVSAPSKRMSPYPTFTIGAGSRSVVQPPRLVGAFSFMDDEVDEGAPGATLSPPSPSRRRPPPPPPLGVELRKAGKKAVDMIERDSSSNATVSMLVIGVSAAGFIIALIYCLLKRSFNNELSRVKRELGELKERSCVRHPNGGAPLSSKGGARRPNRHVEFAAEESPLVAIDEASQLHDAPREVVQVGIANAMVRIKNDDDGYEGGRSSANESEGEKRGRYPRRTAALIRMEDSDSDCQPRVRA